MFNAPVTLGEQLSPYLPMVARLLRALQHSPLLLRLWGRRSPAAVLFDPDYYKASYPDISAGVSPLLHFILRGGFEGRNPHPLFDTVFYTSQNPEVLKRRDNPLLHYLKHGASGDLQPHPLFDARYYLQRNPDVRKIGVNPLLHYILHGASEGRKPHPSFDPAYYLHNCPEASQTGIPALVHFLQRSRDWADPHPLFSCRAYLLHHPDAAASGQNPLMHYVLSGSSTPVWKEGVQYGQTVPSFG